MTAARSSSWRAAASFSPRAALDRLFEGNVTAWVYAALRVGLAGLFLVRHSDWLESWIPLQHHRWVDGLALGWSIRESPPLTSPLVPGLVLGATTTGWLVIARTVLAVLLLVGVRARASAILLATVSYVLLASDRYHYFHHLHLLYISIAWLALAPIGDRLSVEAAWREASPAVAAIWPLQLLRAHVLTVYAASGVAKLQAAWLGGETLAWLDRYGVLRGGLWSALRDLLGFRGIALLTCATELALVPLLVWPRSRRWSVVGALVFHALISASMPVSIFGAQMAVLLVAFWPRRLSSPAVRSKIDG